MRNLVQAEGTGELQGINVRWRNLGWADLIREFKQRSMDAGLVEAGLTS